MLDGLLMLLTLSTLMAIASFLAGSLPLSFTLSQSRLRLISTLGMGVLVGTALIVIIPEGVETLYSANEIPHSHERRGLSPAAVDQRLEARKAPFTNNEPLHIPQYLSRRRDEVDDPEPGSNAFEAMPGPVIPEGVAIDDTSTDPPRTPTAPGEIGILGSKDEIPSPSPSPSPSSDYKHTPHAWIGLSLILGFILMYLIDTLPHLAPPARTPPRQNIYSLSDLSTSPTPSERTSSSPSRSLSTTLGLCIHAAADGIALGASSSSSTTKSLSFIIFLAIMVHKAPAAFGLTSVLLKQGLGKRAARAHLVIFSLAAPAGALATWMIVRTLGGGDSEEEAMTWWTGVLLLFSGGTFLYVAMHTMQEEDSRQSSNNNILEDTGSNGYIDGSHLRERPQGGAADGRSLKLVLAAVGGMLLPLITQVGHAH